MTSKMQDEQCCYFCKTTRNLHVHHVFQGVNRSKSERYGLKVYLCSHHHNMSDESVHMNPNGVLDTILKQEGQRIFEKEYGHEKFMAEFHRNYLED